MFRLPVCPHCGTVYRYGDTKKAQRQKINTCYHCKKQFRAKLLPYVAVEALVLAAICVGINILLLTRMTEMNLVLLFAVTFVFLLLIYVLYPFFMTFAKIREKNKQKTEHNNKKQNKRIENKE